MSDKIVFLVGKPDRITNPTIKAVREVRRTKTKLFIQRDGFTGEETYREDGSYAWFDTFAEAQKFLMTFYTNKLLEVSRHIRDTQENTEEKVVGYLIFEEERFKKFLEAKV